MIPKMDFNHSFSNGTFDNVTNHMIAAVSCATQQDYGDDYQRLEKMINVYIVTRLVLFGLVGNILNFFILKYMKQVSVTGHFVFCRSSDKNGTDPYQ